MQKVDSLLIAPYQYRLYLIQHHCLNLIHRVLYCYRYLDYLINDQLAFRLAWFRCSYLFSIFLFSLGSSILYVLIIPQIFTLNTKSKRDLINSLKLLLKYKLNSYENMIEQINNTLYAGFVGLVIWDYFIDSIEETKPINKFIVYSITIHSIKGIIKIVIEMYLEKSLQEEEQNQFFKIQQFKEYSEKIIEQCPICYDSFKSKDFIAQYLCAGKHRFHKDCLIRWIKMPENKKKPCPYCKQQPQDETNPFL